MTYQPRILNFRKPSLHDVISFIFLTLALMSMIQFLYICFTAESVPLLGAQGQIIGWEPNKLAILAIAEFFAFMGVYILTIDNKEKKSGFGTFVGFICLFSFLFLFVYGALLN